MDAAAHDTVFAAVSHLPHLLAFAYVAQILARAAACGYDLSPLLAQLRALA